MFSDHDAAPFLLPINSGVQKLVSSDKCVAPPAAHTLKCVTHPISKVKSCEPKSFELPSYKYDDERVPTCDPKDSGSNSCPKAIKEGVPNLDGTY